MKRFTQKDIHQEGYELEDCGCQGDYMPINDNIPDIIDKLGELEDIEQELGCSLDIIFDALYRGIVCTPHPFYTHEKIYPKKEYPVVQLFQFYYLKVEDGVVDIKDYGKTWWLKENKSE